MHRRVPQSGFTLIEMIVVVSIISILAAVALPSFRSTLRGNKVSSATNELVASVSLARTEAIRSARGSGMCASNNGTTCGGVDWNAGWIVFIDGNTDGVPGGADDRVVRSIQGIDQLQIVATAAGAGLPLRIVFEANGRIFGSNARTFTLTPDPCTVGDPHLRLLNINATGQVKTVRGACP